MLIKQIRLFGLILLIVGIFISNPNYALSSDNTNILEPAELIRNIGESINLETVTFEHIKNIQLNTPNKNQLMQASIHLRDIARYLSSNSPIKVSLYSINRDISNYQNELYQITDVKKPDGNWNTLTVGHALRLVTEEIAVIENQQQQLVIDLLAKDAKKQIYRPLIGVPLNNLCSGILKQLAVK
jgi:hypothetical protein